MTLAQKVWVYNGLKKYKEAVREEQKPKRTTSSSSKKSSQVRDAEYYSSGAWRKY